MAADCRLTSRYQLRFEDLRAWHAPEIACVNCALSRIFN